MGLRVVKAIRAKYPSWQDIRCRIPGQRWDAINYPPELLPLIATEIDKWGTAHGVWTECDIDDEPTSYAAPPQVQAPAVIPPAQTPVFIPPVQAWPQLPPVLQQQQQQQVSAPNNNTTRQQPHQQPRGHKRPQVAPPADDFAGMEDVAGLMRGLRINRRR